MKPTFFYAWIPAGDGNGRRGRRYLQIKVSIGTRERAETGVVYRNFAAAEKDVARLNQALAQGNA